MELCNSSIPNFQAYFKLLLDSNLIQYRPCSQMAIKFQEEYFEEYIFTDRSFIIKINDTPLVGAILSEHLNSHGVKEISGFGYPGCFIENRALSENDLKKPRKIFINQIKEITQLSEKSNFTFIDLMVNNKINYLTNYMLVNGAKSSQNYTRVIYLQEEINHIYSGISRSYKNRINWCENNIKYKLFNNQNITIGDFTDFKLLHKTVSGRSTRTDITWDIQYERINNNEAFLILGYMKKELITGAYFPYSSNYCWYGVSASKREFFDKPVSHAVIWLAIKYAKDLGCKYFEMGLQEFTAVGKSRPTQKELGISEFKRGFGGFTTARTLISIDGGNI